jgi:6-phosphofructokinase 1
LHEEGFPVVGVPKTIDNDLEKTVITFGFDTASAFTVECLDRLHTTAASHRRIIVVEVMGRYAGWIALESGIAGGADVILIPEIPFHLDRICSAIDHRRQRGGRFSIIVAAEGAYPAGGERVVMEGATASHPVERLGGIGEYVARHLSTCLDMESRVTVLGHLQRGGSPSTFDRCLGSRFGIASLDLVEQGAFGMMTALRGTGIIAVPIEKAVASLKLVDPDGDMVRCAEHLGIMMGR